MKEIKNNSKLYGRERICASMIDTRINGKTLNIGAGEMQWIENQLFLNNKNFISSDLDEKNLGKNNRAINKVRCDATNLPFKDNYFSQIIILDVLEHIKNHEKALSEIFRTLKNGGRLVVCVPNDTFLSYFNPVRYVQHERHYKIDEISLLLRKHGFNIKKIFAGGGIVELTALYLHFLIKYITGEKIEFFNKLRDKEYLKHNKNGNEVAILATK